MENCITSQKSHQLTWLKAIFGQQGIVPVKAHIWYMVIKYFFVPNISFFFNLKQGGEEL